MLTLGSGDSTSQGQKKVWPTLTLHPPPVGCHANSQFHRLDLRDPDPSSGRAQPLHDWDGVTPNLAFWAVNTCVCLILGCEHVCWPDAPIHHLHLGAVPACLSCSVCLLQSPDALPHTGRLKILLPHREGHFQV